MPIVGVHIVKSVTWRGATEEFENVYHYDAPNVSTQQGWADLADAIMDIEQTFHSTAIRFERVRIHGPTDQTKDDDQMIFVGDAGFQGLATANAGMPKEMAVVVQLYMGRSARGYKTFLRKYYHTHHLPNSSAEQAAGNTALAAADLTYFQGKFNALKTISIGGFANDLVKPNGDGIPLGTSAQTLPYAHVRQFRR